MRRRATATVILLLAGLSLAGCAPDAEVRAADAAVAQFHRKLTGGDFAAVQAALAPELARDARMRITYDAVRQRLGRIVSTERTGYEVDGGPLGHWVTLAYVTTFAKGVGYETFRFSTGPDGRLSLIAYFVSSAALNGVRMPKPGKPAPPSTTGPGRSSDLIAAASPGTLLNQPPAIASSVGTSAA